MVTGTHKNLGSFWLETEIWQLVPPLICSPFQIPGGNTAAIAKISTPAALAATIASRYCGRIFDHTRAQTAHDTVCSKLLLVLHLSMLEPENARPKSISDAGACSMLNFLMLDANEPL